MELVEELQPRLINARKLLEEGKVRISRHTGDQIEAYVKGSEVEHRVVISDDKSQCTCEWKAKHPQDRGACKHVLAVEIMADAD
jgi:uncharacterized Zn finger protein